MAGVGLFDLIMLSIRVKLNILLTCILNFYSLILVSERYKPPWGNINEWFYFTNINPINNGEEGSGTERGVMRGGEYGYWKQTAEGEEEIKSEEGRKIGYKKTLVFYQLNGSHPDGSDGVETDWMMYEYRLAVPDQQPPPPPKRKRQQLQLQLQLHTFIFIPSSSSLPKRKIIGGGYNRKTALPFYQPSLSHPLGAPVLKPNLIVQELITVANPPILTTHHHNMRVQVQLQLHAYSYLSLFFLFYSYSIYIYICSFLVCLFVCLLQLDEYCTVLCRIFKSSNGGSTSSSSSSTNDASTSSPGSSSNIPRVLELHTTTTTTTDQTNDDHLTATGQIECLQEEFTDHAHNPFVNIPHTLQNQQQQE